MRVHFVGLLACLFGCSLNLNGCSLWDRRREREVTEVKQTDDETTTSTTTTVIPTTTTSAPPSLRGSTTPRPLPGSTDPAGRTFCAIIPVANQGLQMAFHPDDKTVRFEGAEPFIGLLDPAAPYTWSEAGNLQLDLSSLYEDKLKATTDVIDDQLVKAFGVFLGAFMGDQTAETFITAARGIGSASITWYIDRLVSGTVFMLGDHVRVSGVSLVFSERTCNLAAYEEAMDPEWFPDQPMPDNEGLPTLWDPLGQSFCKSIPVWFDANGDVVRRIKIGVRFEANERISFYMNGQRQVAGNWWMDEQTGQIKSAFTTGKKGEVATVTPWDFNFFDRTVNVDHPIFKHFSFSSFDC